MDVRNPVVAGRFYPSDRVTLEQDLKNYLTKKTKIKNAFAVIAPHAGYMYSGKTAGAVYSSVDIPDVVFVLSPNHTGLGSPISLHPTEGWSTPLGMIKAELNILQAIKDKVSLAQFDPSAQKMEHALEVQIPFIQTMNPNAKIVPITLSGFPFPIMQKLGVAISEIIIAEEERTGKRPLIVASSDMTHFESADSAKRKDMMAIEQIKKLDTKAFLETVDENDISLCGYYPISVTIEAALHYSETKGKTIAVDLVDYTNSGMVTGDKDDVVAYAGMVLHG
jgi:AmmeMemoRadiSam system protein B